MTPRPRRPSRQARARQPRGRSRIGERFEVEVGAIAHGGHAVARVPTGGVHEPTGAPETRVVFVRHALPGERVVVEITEGTDGDRFWRGDAVEVIEAATARVEPPCPYAGPGRCGGCDFQHVRPAAQRDLKTAVLREQLLRLARLDPADPAQGPILDTVVEAVPGDEDGLRWRTRQTYARTRDGSRAMRLHRSHDVIGVEDCLIARLDAREPRPGTVVETVLDRDFTVAADGFWQVHPGAPQALVEAVLAMLDPRPGESVLDLYAGVGLFAAFLGERVGPGGRVVAVEADRRASDLSRGNVPDAEVIQGDVGDVLARTARGAESHVDLVVLDPPREGARRGVVEQIVARTPRAVGYVACDPAALARDVAIFAEHGYRVKALRALDLFPMTHHFESIALLVPGRE